MKCNRSPSGDLQMLLYTLTIVTNPYPAIMKSFESAPAVKIPEHEAEAELEAILEAEENAFLSAHPQNIQRIENAASAQEAVLIAKELINRRMEQTFQFKLLKEVEGVEAISASAQGVRKIIESIKANQEKIGEGGDAFVVVDKNEIKEFPPEICYKFAKEEQTPRGRNSMTGEAEIHGSFYRASTDLLNSKIGVPMPMYTTEMGKDKVLAMEKLPAKSVDDILRGMGRLPDWFEVEAFCDQLQEFLSHMHQKGLYHRDMHIGNVMVSQVIDMPEDGKWGYVIDFGLSSHGMEGMDPYKKEIAGTRFTYADDNGIIGQVRLELKNYQNRNGKGV